MHLLLFEWFFLDRFVVFKETFMKKLPILHNAYFPMTLWLMITILETFDLPVKSPKNLLHMSLRSGLMLSCISSLVRWIPNSSSTPGNVLSTSPTTCHTLEQYKHIFVFNHEFWLHPIIHIQFVIQKEWHSLAPYSLPESHMIYTWTKTYWTFNACFSNQDFREQLPNYTCKIFLYDSLPEDTKTKRA